MKMTEACNAITINEFLYFLSLVDHDDYWIIVSDRCIKKMIDNALEQNKIGLEDGIGEYHRGEISTGEPIIHKLSSLIYVPLVKRIYEHMCEYKLKFDPYELDFNQMIPIRNAIESNNLHAFNFSLE